MSIEASHALDGLATAMKVGKTVSASDSRIHITHRTERRLYTHMIHLLIRAFRNQFGRPKENNHPYGSPTLTATAIARKKCRIEERTVCDMHIYDLSPKQNHIEKVSRRIYYFCGGGFQSVASAQHWQLCSKLVRQLPDTIISIVSYPLAPNDRAPKAFPLLMKLYRALLESASEGESIIFAGDSAGANVILALVLEALREDAEEKKLLENSVTAPPRRHPSALLAISPSVDLTRTNPDIQKIQPHDPLLTPEFVQSTAEAWTGDWDPADRRLSPVNADTSLLAKADVRVHGVTGGYDLLAPDAIKFRDQCAEAGVSGEWLEWDKQMHCFMLSWPYGVPEAREAVGWVVDVLKRE